MSERPAAGLVPPTLEYFGLFGLAAGFPVDTRDLSVRYRELQKSVHPDRYAGASDRERLLAVQSAALINDAYQTLKDPLKRAVYLLQQAGEDPGLERNTAMDPAFLMEQMELREALEEARDGAEPARTLARASAEIESAIAGLVSDLERQFATGALAEACESVRRLQFLERLRQQAGELEEELLAL